MDKEEVSEEAEINSKRLLEMEYFFRNNGHIDHKITFGSNSMHPE